MATGKFPGITSAENHPAVHAPPADGRLEPGELAVFAAGILAAVPLAGALGAIFDGVQDGRMVVTAPLTPNRNAQGTFFGGSASALATLAGYLCIRWALHSGGCVAETLIQKGSIRYREPIRGDVRAAAEMPSPDAWSRTRLALGRHRRARVEVRVALLEAGHEKAGFVGTYALLP